MSKRVLEVLDVLGANTFLWSSWYLTDSGAHLALTRLSLNTNVNRV